LKRKALAFIINHERLCWAKYPVREF